MRTSVKVVKYGFFWFLEDISRPAEQRLRLSCLAVVPRWVLWYSCCRSHAGGVRSTGAMAVSSAALVCNLCFAGAQFVGVGGVMRDRRLSDKRLSGNPEMKMPVGAEADANSDVGACLAGKVGRRTCTRQDGHGPEGPDPRRACCFK